MDKHVILQIIQSGMQNSVPNPDDIPCMDGVYVDINRCSRRETEG